MSYTPTNWHTGDEITAVKLNNIEQGIGDINMSYEPTTWAIGDIITATKLNKMEQGIANGGGGGSSDLSTAEITFVNSGSSGAYNVEITRVVDNALNTGTETISTSKTVTVPLYKGVYTISLMAVYNVNTEVLPTGSGGVTVDIDNLLVTFAGDGTFTAQSTSFN